MSGIRKPPDQKYDVLTEYHQSNSIGGLAQSFASYYTFLKFLWILMVLVGLGATSYHAYTIVEGYFEYPIQVTISITTNDSLVVPSVTVCNLNPVRQSMAKCETLNKLVGIQEIPMDSTMLNSNLTTLYKKYAANSGNAWVLRKHQWLIGVLGMAGINAYEDCKSESGGGYLSGQSPPSNNSGPSGQSPPSNNSGPGGQSPTGNNSGTSGQPPGNNSGPSGQPPGNNSGPSGQSPPSNNSGPGGQSPTGNNSGTSGQPPGNNSGPSGQPLPGNNNGPSGQPPSGNNSGPSGQPETDDSESPQALECSLDWNPIFYYCDENKVTCEEVKDDVNKDGRKIYFLDEMVDELFLCRDFTKQYTEICKHLVICLEDEEASDNFDIISDLMEAGETYDFAMLLEDTTLDDFVDVKDIFAFEPYMEPLGYQAEDFIVECTFDRTKCVPKDFYRSLDKQYGNCFTFNHVSYSDIATVEPNTTDKSGSTYGLRLTLNIDADEYLGLLASEYGVRVSVHHPSVKPVPENDGFVARPGVLTMAAVKLRELKRLPAPYESKCVTEFPIKYKAFVEPHIAYTIRQCQLACMDSHLYQYCGCVQQLHMDNKFKQCSLFDVSTRNCTLSLHMNFSRYFQCDCPPQCHDYSLSLSNSVWPSDAYIRMKVGSFFGRQKLATEMLNRISASNGKTDWIARNLVRLQVYYQSLTYEVIKQEKAYPRSRLWSDLGGVLGLYLGTSIVTLAELIQLVIMLIITGKGKKQEKVEPRIDKAYDVTSEPVTPPEVRF